MRGSKNFNNPQFIECITKVSDDCDICMKRRKAPLEPIVAMPISENFNDIVCMDLKVVDQKFLVGTSFD